MKIKLEKIGNGWWRADCLNLPGSPPCGDGQTKEMAIAALFYQLIHDPNWIKCINRTEPLTINDKIYKSPWKTNG